jgi:hypothetical protein
MFLIESFIIAKVNTNGLLRFMARNYINITRNNMTPGAVARSNFVMYKSHENTKIQIEH